MPSITRSIVSSSASDSRSPKKPFVSIAVWMPIFFAAARNFAAKRCCISGSPPLNVTPPDMILRS